MFEFITGFVAGFLFTLLIVNLVLGVTMAYLTEDE